MTKEEYENKKNGLVSELDQLEREYAVSKMSTNCSGYQYNGDTKRYDIPSTDEYLKECREEYIKSGKCEHKIRYAKQVMYYDYEYCDVCGKELDWY